MSLIVEGYASVFGEIDLHQDIVERGAFMRSITRINPEILCHLEHGPNHVNSGIYDIGLIEILDEDKKGLRTAVNIYEKYEDHIRKLIVHGEITGFSIGFLAINWHRNLNGTRVLTELDLHEISLVKMPSCPGAIIDNIRASKILKHG